MKTPLALACLLMFASVALAAPDDGRNLTPEPLTLTVTREVLHPVDARLFGEFLERADKSEPGPESAWDPATRALRRDVVAVLKQMHIPVLRFPGGSAVEYGAPWTHLVDGGEAARRGDSDSTNSVRARTASFGFDEFMALCRELDAAPLLCVSACGSIMPWHHRSVEQSAELAAAEVAYMNAPAGGALPPNLQRWADLRASNGHPAPYGVKLWQVGNEPSWAYVAALRKQEPAISAGEAGRRYVELIERHVDAMRAVDPSIQLIVETMMEDASPATPVVDRLLERLRGKVQWFSMHVYKPWAISAVKRDGQPVPIAGFGLEDYWYAAVSVPQIDPATGESIYAPASLASIRKAGIPVAVTEWNWNGWWSLARDPAHNAPQSLLANGIGAAGFLHALLRDGDVVKMACQSMLVGSRWSIAAVGVGIDDPSWLIWRPTGQATALYSRNHGDALLRTTTTHPQYFTQPFELAQIEPATKVAFVDALATRTGDRLFVHAINRDFRHVREVRVRLQGMTPDAATAALHRLNGRLQDEPGDGEPIDPAVIEELSVPLRPEADGCLSLRLPPHSVSIYELSVKDTP